MASLSFSARWQQQYLQFLKVNLEMGPSQDSLGVLDGMSIRSIFTGTSQYPVLSWF